jgi:hypothetical protein
MMKNELHSLFEALRPSWGKNGEVAFYDQLAKRLSQIARKNKPWGWRYVQSVDHGTLGHPPSRRFIRAAEVLAAEVDGLPAFIAETEPITIHARPGSVHPNAILLSESKLCANPTCTIHFIPRVPWQKYCPRHATAAARRGVRRNIHDKKST